MKILLLIALSMCSAGILKVTADNLQLVEDSPTTVLYLYTNDCIHCEMLDRRLILIEQALKKLNFPATIAKINIDLVQDYDKEHFETLETVYLSRENHQKINTITEETMLNLENFLLE